MIGSRLFLSSCLAVALSATLASAQTLIPQPREMHAAKAIPLSGGVNVTCSGCGSEDTFAAADLRSELSARGIASSASGAEIALLRSSSPEGKSVLSSASLQLTSEMQAEGYVIAPTRNGIAVVASTSEGVFYGVQTAKQLIDGSGSAAVLHAATIRDWPAMKYRGLDDDLSRGPVPTLEFQKKQIRTIAAYKVNIYSPYFEHTMQYTSQPLMAPPGGAISAAEARELVAYAKQYHITIIPEQEAFGHLHYLLNWEQYTPLSETPHGHVLAPGQAESLKVTKDMFTELAAIYPGPFLHVGADETAELGKGQTKADVDARGLGAVYLDYMKRIVTELKPLNRKLLFWGDIAMHDPDLVKALPPDFKQATIAVAWEYNPQPKGFGKWIDPFTNAGMECWVAPGVNNWSRVYPNYNLMFDNVQQFTAQGQRSGCTGQLNTVWDDDGEALFNANWYGVLYGAAAAWQKGEAPIADFQRSYGRVFHGDATGKIDAAQKELMAAHMLIKTNFKTSDASDLLFWIDPWSADGQKQLQVLRPYLSELRLHAEQAIILVRAARSSATLREQDALDVMELGARRIDSIGLKFQLTDEIATDYARAYSEQRSSDRTIHADVGSSLGDINSVNGKLQDLRNTYSLLHDLYEQAWLKSYRPYWKGNVLSRYDMTVQMWLARIDTVRTAQRQWSNDHTIPTAASLGIPPPPPLTAPQGAAR